MKKLFFSFVMCLFVLGTFAQSSNIALRYDFEGVTGTSVPDRSGNGSNATLVSPATVIQMGKYHALSLGNGSGYLNMGAAAGNVLKGLGSYTISVYYRVSPEASLSGAGYFLWAFSTLQSNSQTNGAYAAYRLNAQRYAFTSTGFGSEAGIEKGGEAQKGVWTHIVYRQNGTQGTLYINGVAAGTNSSIPAPSTGFSAAPTYNWIGRAPFSGDNYLRNTLVHDFCLYNKPLTVAEISALTARCDTLQQEWAYGTPGNFTSLQSKVTTCLTALNGANPAQYPPLALVEFEDAIASAQELITDGRASSMLIAEALTTLNAAQTKFTSMRNVVFTVPAFSSEYNSNRGFVHPGGLHTEADFDRVKALLAAKDPTIVAAYNKLTANGYSSSSTQTYPTETIVRGGGVGENYMNAARGASMAYQNALRWKISGTKANADAAVRILNAWAANCKGVGGDSNYALAGGLYGYGFAQAAELMRDYEGWARADFKTFISWMQTVWYPPVIGFLRGRNDTWRGNGGQGERPGHYWSNWGLCNIMALMTMGILCDDVYMYNQALSFYKHDQVGTFRAQRTSPILNDGLTEYIGNLVPVVFADNRGPYGYLGQMQESGRDQGHTLMALGLAVDFCQMGLNQGDDLFALMDNRLAAGIEYVAAYNCNTPLTDLPWMIYRYSDTRTALHNAWQMNGPNEGSRGQFRPYWDRVIGHYEGIKGVDMPYSRMMHFMRDNQGVIIDSIDNGGGAYGQNSGGFDHLGFSTLMCYRPTKALPDEVPTQIIPQLLYNGRILDQAELGGLTNKYTGGEVTSAVPRGNSVTLMPTLPEGTTDTGNWLWESGETTRELNITTNESRLYRVTYTNENGVQSKQVYSIAVVGDCLPTPIKYTTTVNGKASSDTILNIMRGESVTLSLSGGSYGSYLWNNGAKTNSITVNNIRTDRTYTVVYKNQGDGATVINFHINVSFLKPTISINNGAPQETNKAVTRANQSVKFIPIVPLGKEGGEWLWSDGSTEPTLTVTNIQAAVHRTLTYTYAGEVYTQDFHVYLSETGKVFEPGKYHIKDAVRGTYLTNNGQSAIPTFADLLGELDATQLWRLTREGTRYKIVSLADSAYLNNLGQFSNEAYNAGRHSYTLYGVTDGDLVAIRNTSLGNGSYWSIDANGAIAKGGTTTEYLFELILVEPDGIMDIVTDPQVVSSRFQGIYTIDGRLLHKEITPDIILPAGAYIINGQKVIITQ